MSSATLAQPNGTTTADDPFALEVPAPGGNFETPPAGNHAAVCFGLVDLGTHEETYQGETKQQVQTCLLFETPGEADAAGNPFMFAIGFTRSLNEKAKLRKFLETWRGRPFAENEVISLASVLGKPCLLNVTHSPGKKDRVYANAGAATPLPKGMTAPAQHRTAIAYSLRDLAAGVEPPDAEWMPRLYGRKLAEVVKDSREWLRAHGGPAGGATTPAAQAAEDDDIPF